jgi:methylmalonyl-CoA mutase cobalamin-binding subunit
MVATAVAEGHQRRVVVLDLGEAAHSTGEGVLRPANKLG